MGDLHVSCAGHLSDRVQDLHTGRVRIEGVSLHYLPLSPAEAFRRMLQGEFDAGEMSLATHIVKVSRGEDDFVAIPAFPSRTFRHSAIYVNERSGIADPGDLVGRRVGVPEYQMTAALWVRGLLEHEYGVRPGDMSWVTGGLRDPGRRPLVDVDVPGVSVRHEPERSLDELLRTGEIDAVVAPQAPPSFAAGDGVRRLFPDYRRVEAEYFAKTRLFPIMHTVVLRRDFHREHPWVAASLFRAFDAARTAAIGRLTQREPLPVSLPWMQSELDETIEIMGPDFWPYGVERNQQVLEAACRYAWEQGLCARAVEVEELFDPGVVGLESSGIL